MIDSADLDTLASPAARQLVSKMSDLKPVSFTEEEKAYARALWLALAPFRELRPTMPMQYVTSYLLVVMHDDKSVNEYAQMADVAPSVMTRHLLDIGERNREGEEGFGLVTQGRDRNDLRRTYTKGTSKGKAVLHRIMAALKTIQRSNSK